MTYNVFSGTLNLNQSIVAKRSPVSATAELLFIWFPSLFILHLFRKRTFGDKWHWFFYGAYVLFTQTTLSKVTDSTYPSQWPVLILSSSTTGLPDCNGIDASVLAV